MFSPSETVLFITLSFQLIFQLIRWIIYSLDDGYILLIIIAFISVISGSLLVIKFFCQKNISWVYYFLIVQSNILLGQYEALFQFYDNNYQNFFYLSCTLYIFQKTELSKHPSKICQFLKYCVIGSISICFKYNLSSNDDQSQLKYQILSLINQKFHIWLVIATYFSIFSKQPIKIEKEVYNTVKDEQLNTLRNNQKSRTSLLDINEVLTERKEISPLAQIQEEYQILLDSISEGIILLQIHENKESQNDFKFEITFANQFSKIMFGNDEKQILKLFEQTQSEIKYLESRKDMLGSSMVSAQSLAQIQFKSFKNNAFQKQQLSSSSKMSKSLNGSIQFQEMNTVLKTLQYAWMNRATVFDIQSQGKLETIIVDAKFDQNQQKRSVEIIILLGKGKSLMLICRDVIHRDKIMRLNYINEQKSKTLSFVSHEYRSPLNILINILNKHKSRNDLEKFLKEDILILYETTQYMMNLSNDILDLAQIKNDSFRLNQNIINLINLGDDCLKLFSTQAQQQSITLKVESNQKQLYIYSDKNRVKQIIFNLIVNAMKFTHHGTVIISFHQHDKQVDIGVKDNGIGITLEDQNKLFKAFGKIMNSQNQKLNEQGVGLGLLISNKLAQQLSQGKGLKILSNTDNINHGLYFYFTLQIQDFHCRASFYKPQECMLSPQTPKFVEIPDIEREKQVSLVDDCFLIEKKIEQTCHHILLVDDNVFNLNVLEYNIHQQFDFEIDKAMNGQEALEKVLTQQCSKLNCNGYQAIFMDLEMPLMNGIETAKKILQLNSSINIFLVTGYEEQQDFVEAKQIGIKEILVKPVQIIDIQKLFKEYKFIS